MGYFSLFQEQCIIAIHCYSSNCVKSGLWVFSYQAYQKFDKNIFYREFNFEQILYESFFFISRLF